MTNPREKRRHERIDVHIPVGIYLKGADKAEEGEIINISRGGAFVRANIPIEMNQELSIEIRFKGSTLFGGKVVPKDFPAVDEKAELSTVRWTQGPSGKGFGIEFNNLNPDKLAFIEKLIEYYRLLEENT